MVRPMAKGRQEHQARKEAVSYLGKDLARRASRKCELCEEGGIRLDPHEVEPLPEDPDLEQAVLLCGECADGVNNKKLGQHSRWRFLEGVVWTEVAPVQVVAVRVLRQLAEAGEEWASALNESIYLDEAIAAWVDGASPDAVDVDADA